MSPHFLRVTLRRDGSEMLPFSKPRRKSRFIHSKCKTLHSLGIFSNQPAGAFPLSVNELNIIGSLESDVQGLLVEGAI